MMVRGLGLGVQELRFGVQGIGFEDRRGGIRAEPRLRVMFSDAERFGRNTN